MKRYAFFLRHFNDIDNITPAIYFLLERLDCRVLVVIYSVNYDYRDNSMLSFLKDNFQDRIQIHWIGGALGYSHQVTKNKKYRLLNYLTRRLFRRPTIEKSVIVNDANGSLNKYFNSLFNEWGNPDQIIFDQNRTSVIRGLIKTLRDIGQERIISLPVSPWININVLRQTDFIKLDSDVFYNKHDYSEFDEIGQVDSYYADNLEHFFSLLGAESPFNKKVKVLGSIRYCTEWIDVLSSEKMKPYLESPLPKSEKTKVLILPSHPKNNSFWIEYIRTLQFLSQFKDFEFIIKPHTRYDTAYSKLPDNLQLKTDVQTSTLIDWSDIILFWSTSVALEGYQKKKYMVCLDYLNGNYSSYRKLNAGFICNSRDDLMEIFINNENSELINFESQLNYNNVITNIIENGKNDSVVDNYLDFINNK